MFSLKATVKKPPKPVCPAETSDNWPTQIFECCGETIQRETVSGKVYCVICGNHIEANDTTEAL